MDAGDFRTQGGFGTFAERTLKNVVSSQGTGEPWRDVLPLPVPKHVCDTVSQVLGEPGTRFSRSIAELGLTVWFLGC